MDASPGKFFEKQISQQSIYEFYDEDVKKETFKELTSIEEKEAKPYVLVIDEINRGNVSAIFGELITLIEEDKRQGATNELFVTLPYSKKRFTVPSNLHIIGTMNTADRSVEALDTALRRRFSFVEMLPDPKLLSTKGTNGDGMIEDVNLQELLTTINSRIEVLIDRDHTIGHAFFINDKSIDDLKHTFKNKIIPLLQEYFYGNYEKMALVIGNSFFHIQDQKSVVFAETTNDYDLSNKIYTILDCTAEGFDFITAIQKLMNKTISQQTQVRTDSSYGDN
jgi:5-methylcytosine-specific restriction endonuclease McrBC GTP-binding regulatory subunit McrB